MLMTFPAMVTLLTTTPGVNVTTRDYLLVQMGIFFPRQQPYYTEYTVTHHSNSQTAFACVRI